MNNAEFVRMRKEQARRRLYNQGKGKLLNDIEDWSEPKESTLKCFSLYNYYPTHVNWPLDEDEWEIRRLIWDFKADPHKSMNNIQIKKNNKIAYKKIIPDIVKVLDYYFEDDIDKLTLVCIPASKKTVNNRRYQKFSQELCKETEMTNGFSYVNVVADATPKHIGGSGDPQVKIDSHFFKDKYVMLFDDVITSGSSMEYYKNRLEKVGATVICGMSIGVTKHKREENPIDQL